MSTSATLPKTMQTLLLTSTSSPLTLKILPTPSPEVGSATVRIVAVSVISYARDVYNGKRAYPFPKPLVPGSSAIGRIAALPADATKLKEGDLVFVDITVRSRDDPTDVYLAGVHEGYTEGSKKLMRDVYRDWTLAEYCRVPLENLTYLNETRLAGAPDKGGLGCSIPNLSVISRLIIPYGGLKDIGLQPGQTLIVAPATGPFGSAAVLVALAMGARVIAFGRNKTALAALMKKVPAPERVEMVPITGDVAADCAGLKKFGEVDAFFDIGPPEAHASTHIKSAILALRHGGRVSLMGGYREDVPVPHVMIMHRNIRLYGKWMYERSDIADMVKLIESGMLKLGPAGGFEEPVVFPLEKWEEAFDQAAENVGLGKSVVIAPGRHDGKVRV